MIKTANKVLSFVLAFAVLAVSLFTGVVTITADAATCNGTIDVYDGTTPTVSLLDSTKENSETNPYIITDANQIHALAAGSLKNEADEYVSAKGYYFKVADGIEAFVMQRADKHTAEEIMSLSSAEAVNTIFGGKQNTTDSTVWWASMGGQPANFSGQFDGNGVEIYGICGNTDTLGLFTAVSGNTTLKNFTIKNSYFSASSSDGVAAVVGRTMYDTTADTVTIESVAVVNNYVAQTKSSSSIGASAVLGSTYRYIVDDATKYDDVVVINNCLVYGNVLDNSAYINADGTSLKSALISQGGYTKDTKVSNVIALGVMPWTKNAGGYYLRTLDNGNFVNIYTDTDCSEINQYSACKEKFCMNDGLTASDLIGATADEMSALSADDWFFNTTDYPQPRALHNIEAEVASNNNGTHSTESCDCGLKGIAVTCTYNTSGVCTACGYADPNYDATGATYTGTPDATLEGAGTKESPYIIKTADELAAVALGMISGATVDTYYEVDPSVKALYMHGGKVVAEYTDVADVKEYFATNNTGTWEKSAAFTGHFDGNGVTVYGLYGVGTGMMGLFPQVVGHSSIKNIALANSYISSTHSQAGVGGLVGATTWQSGADAIAAGSVTFENIAVINSYITNPNASAEKSAVGAVMGRPYNKDYVAINNCLVYGNEVVNAKTSEKVGLIGQYNGISDGTSFTNIVTVGIAPWSIGGGWYVSHVDAGHWKNVYTDASIEEFKTSAPDHNTDANLSKFNIVGLTADEISGATADEMSALSTADWFFNTTTYPQLRVFHNTSVADNGDGTHTESCSDCDLVGVAASHTYSNGTCTVCGYTDEDLVGAVIWEKDYDDDFIAHEDQPGDGTAENPYIISTAEQLASVCANRVVDVLGKDKSSATPIDTTGVYFKVADGITKFYMNGGKEVAAMTNSADVKAYFEANGGRNWWINGKFEGIFDGNGATVYGLYADKEGAGLFQYLGEDATIKNIKVANSYMKSAYAGGLFGRVQWYTGIDDNDATVTVENCAVVNCYIESTNTAWDGDAGLVGGSLHADNLTVTNFVGYGNTVVNATGNQAGLWGAGTKTNTITNVVVIDAAPYSVNSKSAGCKAANFTNTYTNVDITIGEEKGGSEYAENQVKQLTAEEMVGNTVLTTMSALDWKTEWLATDNEPELRVFHELALNASANDIGHFVECSDCGLKGTEPHTYDVATGKCEVCNWACAHGDDGDEFVWNSNNDGDCMTADTGKFVCSICGFSSPEIDNPNFVAGHTPGEVKEENRVESTCTTAGSYDSVTYCSVCGEVASSEKIDLPLDPDNHVYDDAKDPDCNEGCGHVREVYTLGDINDDGEINNRDIALLMQYINGWDVEIPEIAAADVVADGEINNKDYAILMQYINGWEVTLG